MFAESLLDTSWADRSRRGWTTMASFTLLTFVVAVLLALPLLYTEALPQLQVLSSLVVPASSQPSTPPSAARATQTPASNMLGHELMAPQRIPTAVRLVDDAGVLPPSDLPPGIGVPHGTGVYDPNGVLNSIGTTVSVAHPAVATVAPPLRVSVMMEGNLIYRVQPTYPPLARAARIQGPVRLEAVISREGLIENLHVVSGHPMLSPAAMNAVKQWRYRPYKLNGEPVEVETQVTVIFSLSEQ